MSNYPISHILMMGLPNTGKTTFTAALWHVLTSNEVTCSLKLKETHGDVEYLNQIRDKYICCEEVGRTVQNMEQVSLAIRLMTEDEKVCTELVFPDLSGETFRDLWERRSWKQRHDNLARQAQGVLLFIHPNGISEPKLIEEIVYPAEAELNQPAAKEEEEVWQPESSHTAVKLVELLQCLLFDPAAYQLRKAAVIISAWDVVQGKWTAGEFLERRLPLLAQFLRSNRKQLAYRVYGLSAQSGDLVKDADKLADFVKHSERINIVGHDCLPHDITAPIKWFMEE